MAVGSKYVSNAPVLTFTATGSTTVNDLAPFSKDFKMNESMDSADGTGYGSSNKTYQPTIGDSSASWTQFLEDGYALEDVMTKGAKGTIIFGPNGNATGKKKITIPCFISNRSRSYPYADMATMDMEVMPTGAVVEATYP